MYDKATARKLSIKEKVNTWIKNDEIILVYTMGKVGSSTLVNSIREIGQLEIQPHSLVMNKRGTYFVKPDRKLFGIIRDTYKTTTLRIKTSIWKMLTKKKSIKVITLVREPISRNISAFFEQSHYITHNINELNEKEINDLFWKYANHHAPLNWFDDEIKKVFNIDVYNKPLNKKKFQRYKEKNVDLLVLRLEDLKSQENIIADFLSAPNFTLVNANVGDNKIYADKYRSFKKNLVVSSSYKDKMYNSKYMKHFYSEEEIQEFYEKYKALKEE
jgi:hypothetical protein